MSAEPSRIQLLPPGWDWKNPNYAAIFAERARRLQLIRRDIRQRGTMLRDLKQYYRHNIPDFINDWGVTVDQRVAARGRAPIMPFLLWPKQREYVDWMLERYHNSEPGLAEKSRDVGASWLFMTMGCSLCLFWEDISIGVGSATEIKIDRSGDPDTLFYKGRMFLNYLPPEFRGGWDMKKNSAYMRLTFPETGASITGEAGDNIGRGGRKSIYGIDESAHLEHPKLVDASLAASTDCRIDMSSVRGMANSFAEKRHGGRIKVFTFHWRDDPRKDDEWYAKKAAELDPITLAQEIDISYTASVEGIVIPAAWVQAAVDAHKKLGIEPTGVKHSAFDIADRGIDKNAWGARHGVVLTHAQSWTGRQKMGTREWDTFDSVEKVFYLCDEAGIPSFSYDADGLGAPVRGDARKINERRQAENAKMTTNAGRFRVLIVTAFRGSAQGDALYMPEAFVRGPDGTPLDRRNKDYFANYKAQAWWALRFRFQQTYRAIHGLSYDPDDIISLSSDIPELARLMVELSQPVYLLNNAGKILIDKTPDDVASPNLGDMVMMVFAPRRTGLNISDNALESI